MVKVDQMLKKICANTKSCVENMPMGKDDTIEIITKADSEVNEIFENISDFTTIENHSKEEKTDFNGEENYSNMAQKTKIEKVGCNYTCNYCGSSFSHKSRFGHREYLDTLVQKQVTNTGLIQISKFQDSNC